jgi:hypothetical protein
MAFYDYTGGSNFSTLQAITTTADSTNIFDVTGAGVGSAPAMIGAGGLNTAMGIDIGSGDSSERPEVLITVTTAGTGAGTITFTLKAAPDSGTYTEGTYTVLESSAAFVGTALVAGTQIKLPVPPAPSTFSGLPRFYKLTYTVSGSATATVTSNLSINLSMLKPAKIYGSNFVVAS